MTFPKIGDCGRPSLSSALRLLHALCGQKSYTAFCVRACVRDLKNCGTHRERVLYIRTHKPCNSVYSTSHVLTLIQYKS